MRTPPSQGFKSLATKKVKGSLLYDIIFGLLTPTFSKVLTDNSVDPKKIILNFFFEISPSLAKILLPRLIMEWTYLKQGSISEPRQNGQV